MMNMNLTIKPLTKELSSAYLDFFDHRAFSDNNPNGPCYCTSPNQSREEIEKMVQQFRLGGVKPTLRKYAQEMLQKELIHGYLAFDGEEAVAWCNAADMNSYAGFVPDFARPLAMEKTISVVCFEVSPPYRGKGVAATLLRSVCEDAAKKGYQAVEGYARIQPDAYDYHGCAALYLKAGFLEITRQDGCIILRKTL